MQQLKQRVGGGESGNVDYYALIGLRRGCSRSEVERAHLLLMLRHKPDRSSNFIDKCELGDEKDVVSVRDRAKMSALLLYRMIQRGYASLMSTVLDEEAQRRKAAVEPLPVEVFQGVFCRDLLSQTGFNHPIPVKYEPLQSLVST